MTIYRTMAVANIIGPAAGERRAVLDLQSNNADNPGQVQIEVDSIDVEGIKLGDQASISIVITAG